MLRKLRYLVEALGAYLWMAIFRTLPLDTASAVGAWLGKNVGPLLGVNKTAKRNLERAFPELSAAERAVILRDMWDNLGRVAGEFAHMPAAAISSRITILGWDEHVAPLLAENKGIIFISGHLANWEIAPRSVFDRGIPLLLIYRPANNPYVDKIIHSTRAHYDSEMFPKGASGALKLVRALKSGKSVGMLVDQKMNEGIPVPFFGRDAMTAPATVQMALKLGVQVVPIKIQRTNGVHFTTQFFAPLTFAQTGNEEEDVKNGASQINLLLETWVREKPEQWFWVHNRWPKA